MSTRKGAVKNAQAFANRENKTMYVYRVGPAWMFTSQASREVVQGLYKVPVSEFEPVHPGVAATPQTSRVATVCQRFVIDLGEDITGDDVFTLLDNALRERGMKIAAEQRGIRGTFIHVVKE